MINVVKALKKAQDDKTIKFIYTAPVDFITFGICDSSFNGISPGNSADSWGWNTANSNSMSNKLPKLNLGNLNGKAVTMSYDGIKKILTFSCEDRE